MRASWRREEYVGVESEERLDAVVASVRGLGEPTMLVLEDGADAWLVVGLGYPVAFVGWGTNSGTSFHSVGNLLPRGSLSFMFKGQPSEVAAAYAIPESDALAAVREFFRTRARPTGVRWEEDG